MKFVLPNRRRRGEYTVTDARRSMSEDISYRQRRYLISMGVRVVAFLLAVFLFHGIWRFIAAAIALVVPYFAVVFANGGREPDNASAFEPFEPNLPERTDATGGPLAAPDGRAPDLPAPAGPGSAADGRTRADGSVRDGTNGNGVPHGGAPGNGTPGDGASRTARHGNERAPGAGAAWSIAWQGDPNGREGQAFVSGEQADTRS
ncbi:MAG TPA: DUF3099 domain-containing protein [Streptosporangiaceae bacterium]|nr:DUF3099 domain-containing protein [Streptosporangiaceae bacterium]